MFSILQVNNSVLWKGVAGKVASHKGETSLGLPTSLIGEDQSPLQFRKSKGK